MKPEKPSLHDSTELLDQHRRDIEALDRRILHLICERLELASQIGDLKTDLGIPLRNFKVEAQVHRRFEKASTFLGLDSSLGRDLALFLIEKAVEHQAGQRDATYAGDALDTVVVGGKGGMGRWIARLLRGQGHRVRVLDPADEPSEFQETTSMSAVSGADLVLVAVPLGVCPDVLRQVARERPVGVVAEMCSLKGHLAPTLEELRQSGVRVVSFHPMFGPGVRMLSDRTIVFCTGGADRDLDVVRRLFSETSACLVDMDPAEHDRRMRIVLGLTHLLTMVYARAVHQAGVSPAELAEVAGVTFGRQIKATRELAWENPDLFFEIQRLMPMVDGPVSWIRDAVDDWGRAVAGEDRDDFVEMMRGCREGIGPESGTR